MTPTGEMRFDFASPTRVVFGVGKLNEAGAIARTYGTHAFVVTGSNTARAEPLLARLRGEGLKTSVFPSTGEPTLAGVMSGVAACKASACDVIIGFGGGSAVDAAKAIAAMVTNPGDPLDYLEVIGKGQSLNATPLPFVAIPTTAGTGSEVTKNAVIGSPEHKVKVSLRSPLMLARVAIVDPELTLGLPPAVTATTGMDALTQCIEAYVSSKANPFTDAFCIQGIQRAARSLRIACMDGGNLAARTDMALASLYSGIALANAGLGAVHAFAGPLGGMFPAPHGALCAALLPAVMKTNLSALRTRQPDGAALRRFDELAQWLTHDPSAKAEDGLAWLQLLQSDLKIPRLRAWGSGEAQIPDILLKAAAASSMKGNPLKLEETELRAILALAL